MRGSPAEEEDRKMTAAGMRKRVGGGLEGRETVTDEKRSGRGFGKGREGPNWGRRDGCEDSRKGREDVRDVSVGADVGTSGRRYLVSWCILVPSIWHGIHHTAPSRVR